MVEYGDDAMDARPKLVLTQNKQWRDRKGVPFSAKDLWRMLNINEMLAGLE